MKKLTKISLLRDETLLTKTELQQLWGSTREVDCLSAKTKEECAKLYGTCVAGNNNGVCYYSPIGCICNPGPFGG